MSGQAGGRRPGVARWLCGVAALGFAVEADGASAGLRAIAGHAAALSAVADRDTTVIRVNQITFAVDDIHGSPGQDLPVAIELPSAIELAAAGADGVAFVLVRNIPPGVKLSAGMASGRLWILPLQDVPGLELFAERTVIGSFVLEFNLIGARNNRIAQQSVALHLRPANPVGQVGTAATAVVAPEKRATVEEAQGPIRPAARLAPQEEAVLLKRGENLLQQGGIAAARIILEELAQKGSANGALALARSYDPAHTSSRGSGPAPDLEKALAWYRRAHELGSAEARARIAEIGERR